MSKSKKIQLVQKFNIAYIEIPFKRNQDLVKITSGTGKLKYIASIVDGWNNPKEIPSNMPGRAVAKYVAETLPKIFLKQTSKNITQNAKRTTEIIDQEVIQKWPAHTSCVGAFLFSFEKQNILLTIGSVLIYIYKNKCWKKPKEIGNYWLDPEQYPSNVSRFIGRGELKKDPLFSAKPDILVLKPTTPLLITTDGFSDIVSESKLIKTLADCKLDSPEKYLNKIVQVIKKTKQKDDITLFIKI